jgi:hypothetical protein
MVPLPEPAARIGIRELSPRGTMVKVLFDRVSSPLLGLRLVMTYLLEINSDFENDWQVMSLSRFL